MMDILGTLWKVSWQVALVGAVIWLTTRLMRKAPAAWRYALWLIVLVKLFVPPFAHFPADWAFWIPAASGTTKYEVATQPARIVGATSTDFTRLPNERYVDNGAGIGVAIIGVHPDPYADVTQAEPRRSMDNLTRQIIIGVWLLGVGTAGVILLMRYIRQRRLIRDSSPANSDISKLVKQCAMQLRVRRLPHVGVSEGATTPMLVGLAHPTILLPPRIAESCSENDLAAMLMHELAHVKRLDMIGVWLSQLAQAVFFFHPVVWLAGHEMRKEREAACDELVLASEAIDRQEYASGYVSALRLANSDRKLSTALAMAEPFEVERQRLDRILGGPVRRLSVWWIAALLVVLAAVMPTFAGVGPRKVQQANTGTAESPSEHKALQGPGVVVVLRDAVPPRNAKPAVAQRCIIHDADIRNVVNELLAAGAEAVSVNGQRVYRTTPIRALGYGIEVDGIPANAPFNIAAIGPSEAIMDLLRMPGGTLHRLGTPRDPWLKGMIAFEKRDHVVIPAHTEKKSLKQAGPVD